MKPVLLANTATKRVPKELSERHATTDATVVLNKVATKSLGCVFAQRERMVQTASCNVRQERMAGTVPAIVIVPTRATVTRSKESVSVSLDTRGLIVRSRAVNLSTDINADTGVSATGAKRNGATPSLVNANARLAGQESIVRRNVRQESSAPTATKTVTVTTTRRAMRLPANATANVGIRVHTVMKHVVPTPSALPAVTVVHLAGMPGPDVTI